MSESMPNFWWCPTHHLYRGGEERPCPDAEKLAWDAACHLHGAHGKRGCVKHDVDPINCDCGCDYKVFS
jgi:hypothetical protein